MRIPLLVLAALAVSTTAAAQTNPPAAPEAGVRIEETIALPQRPPTAWIGMSMEQESRSSELGTDREPWLVTAIMAGSPAETAGLRVGDRILVVDGCDTRDSCAPWGRLVPGQRYQLRVRSGTEERDVTLVPAPPSARPGSR
jgi:C-terminal processing protease CtpA/Prc